MVVLLIPVLMLKYTEIMRYIPGVPRRTYYKIRSISQKIFNFFEKQVQEHQNAIDLNAVPTDYVDAFLKEKNQQDAESFDHSYT